MPIYEYRCSDCGHKLEALQKISDPKLTTCPECGKESLTKLVSASAFVLKGTGWYVTDFRDKNKPASGEKKSTGNASESTKSDSGESKSETKAADKGDSKKSESADSKKTDNKPAKKAAGE